jgi:hypothetical protein
MRMVLSWIMLQVIGTVETSKKLKAIWIVSIATTPIFAISNPYK